MKFELEPYRRNIPDQDLLQDMRDVAVSLGSNNVTMDDYTKHGKYHASSITKRFGSWPAAVKKAGLSNSRSEINIPLEKLIEDLKKVAQRLGKSSLTHKEYNQNGQFSPSTLIKHFGSWSKVLEENGLKKTRNYGVSDEEYFQNLETIWRTLGRQPRYSEIQKPFSLYSAGAYERRYGSWRKALEAFVAFINIENDQEVKEKKASAPSAKLTSPPSQKTTREISWRLRFLVMRRDNFKCCLCGRSPATDHDVTLQIDHIKPWSKGGETEIDNLQTCCKQCNIGKSDLPITG